MNSIHFNLSLNERKWTWIVTYDFVRKANLNSLLFRIRFKVYLPLEDPLFHSVEMFVWFPFRFLKLWHFEYKDVSSPNILQIDLIPSGKSWIYVKKKSGLETDPCRKPERTLSHREVWPLRITLCLRSVK